jgi:hypothetical protein
MPKTQPCPRCGQPLSAASADGQLVCGICGEQTRRDSGHLFRLPEAVLLQTPCPGTLEQLAAGRPAQTLRPVLAAPPTLPAATPTVPKDADKALTSFALGLFRVRGWPCRELEGYRAFVVRAGFRNPTTGIKDICNITVSAAGGVLTFETTLLPLPAPPWQDVRETLNALNLCSGGSVFLLRECGVAARHRLLPHSSDAAAFCVDGVMQALRQLNYDRRLALPILESALRQGSADHAAIQKAFALPLAPDHVAPLTLDHLYNLGQFIGCHTVREGEMVGLSPESCSLGQCPVWASAAGGVLRAWTILGEDVEALLTLERWKFIRQVIRTMSREAPGLSRAQLGQLLERLNNLNDNSALLRYAWHNSKIYALAVCPPSAGEFGVDEFRSLVQALFRCASAGPSEMERIRRAV